LHKDFLSIVAGSRFSTMQTLAWLSTSCCEYFRSQKSLLQCWLLMFRNSLEMDDVCVEIREKNGVYYRVKWLVHSLWYCSMHMFFRIEKMWSEYA